VSALLANCIMTMCFVREIKGITLDLLLKECQITSLDFWRVISNFAKFDKYIHYISIFILLYLILLLIRSFCGLILISCLFPYFTGTCLRLSARTYLTWRDRFSCTTYGMRKMNSSNLLSNPSKVTQPLKIKTTIKSSAGDSSVTPLRA